MRPLRFVCLFVILISLLVLAQSSRAPLVNQPNGTAHCSTTASGAAPESFPDAARGTFRPARG